MRSCCICCEKADIVEQTNTCCSDRRKGLSGNYKW